jgi:hypothetical protein
MLELGIGTGNLTGRLMRMSGGFISQLWSDDNHGERSFIEFDGWDSNRKMVEIASARLTAAAQQAHDRVIRPNLQVREFDASKSEDSPPRYDLVVGSLFSHYWMDSRPNRPITKASDLREFRSFLEAARDTLLLSDGMQCFSMFSIQMKGELTSRRCGKRILSASLTARRPPTLTSTGTRGSITQRGSRWSQRSR